MVDFIVDDVQDERVRGPWETAERGEGLREPGRWNLRPEPVHLVGAFVPELKDSRLLLDVARGVVPRPGQYTAHHRGRHGHQLHGEVSKRSHPADGIREQLIVGKGLDHPASQAPVSLPVLEELLRGDKRVRHWAPGWSSCRIRIWMSARGKHLAWFCRGRRELRVLPSSHERPSRTAGNMEGIGKALPPGAEYFE